MKPSNSINYLSVLEHLLRVMCGLSFGSCIGTVMMAKGALIGAVMEACGEVIIQSMFVHSNSLQTIDAFIPI